MRTIINFKNGSKQICYHSEHFKYLNFPVFININLKKKTQQELFKDSRILAEEIAGDNYKSHSLEF